MGMLVLYFCSFLLSDTKGDLKPSRIRRYLGILCDSDTTSFRVPQYQLQNLHTLIHAALEHDSLNVKMSKTIAGKSVSMSVAIRPSSLWTHYMLAAISKTNGRAVQLSRKPGLLAELNIYFNLSATSQDGPWYQPRHYAAQFTVTVADASFN